MTCYKLMTELVAASRPKHFWRNLSHATTAVQKCRSHFSKKTQTRWGLWRNQEEKRSSKRKPWLQALPSGSPTPPLPLCFFYKARARGKPRSGEQGWLRPRGCRLWAAGLAVAAAAEPMQRPGMGLPVLWGCGCTRPGCPGIGKR